MDRIDNNKGYYKENFRWVTRAENNRNKRTNILNWFTVKSIRRLYGLKKFTLKELSKIYNINYETIHSVVYHRTWREQ